MVFSSGLLGKKTKDIEIRKGEVKLSALAETVRTNTWVQQGCWIKKSQKSVLFLYIGSEQSKNEIKLFRL